MLCKKCVTINGSLQNKTHQNTLYVGLNHLNCNFDNGLGVGVS